jgi:hypothetical protein
MADVCIVFSKADEGAARFLADKIKSVGKTVEGYTSDTAPIEQIAGATGVFVTLWSPSSGSDDTLLATASRARETGKLLHARMLGAAGPAAFASDPAIDLTGWKGEDLYPAWRRMVAEIEARLSGQPAPVPPAPEPVVTEVPAPSAPPPEPEPVVAEAPPAPPPEPEPVVVEAPPPPPPEPEPVVVEAPPPPPPEPEPVVVEAPPPPPPEPEPVVVEAPPAPPPPPEPVVVEAPPAPPPPPEPVVVEAPPAPEPVVVQAPPPAPEPAPVAAPPPPAAAPVREAPAPAAPPPPRAPEASSRPVEPTRSGSPVGLILGVAALVVIGAGGFFGYQGHQAGTLRLPFLPPSQAALEMDAWTAVDRSDPAALAAFIAASPDSAYLGVAQSALSALENEKFDAAMQAIDAAPLEAFLAAFPNSARRAEAQMRLDRIRGETPGVLIPLPGAVRAAADPSETVEDAAAVGESAPVDAPAVQPAPAAPAAPPAPEVRGAPL